MRFASVPMPKSEQRSPAAEFVCRLLGQPPVQPAMQSQTAPVQPEPPVDLDQRVRLLGEW